MNEHIKDHAASVRQRLLNKAKKGHQTFNQLLTYYFMERFIHRLSITPSANNFVLKGALMFTV